MKLLKTQILQASTELWLEYTCLQAEEDMSFTMPAAVYAKSVMFRNIKR